MILLDRNKAVYHVTFDLGKTTLFLPLRANHYPESLTTTCTIAQIGSSQLSQGTVTKGPKDKNDMRVAYKKAFGRALNNFTPSHDLRADLWACFLKGGVSRAEAGIAKQVAKA